MDFSRENERKYLGLWTIFCRHKHAVARGMRFYTAMKRFAYKTVEKWQEVLLTNERPHTCWVCQISLVTAKHRGCRQSTEASKGSKSKCFMCNVPSDAWVSVIGLWHLWVLWRGCWRVAPHLACDRLGLRTLLLKKGRSVVTWRDCLTHDVDFLLSWVLGVGLFWEISSVFGSSQPSDAIDMVDPCCWIFVFFFLSKLLLSMA